MTTDADETVEQNKRLDDAVRDIQQILEGPGTFEEKITKYVDALMAEVQRAIRYELDKGHLICAMDHCRTAISILDSIGEAISDEVMARRKGETTAGSLSTKKHYKDKLPNTITADLGDGTELQVSVISASDILKGVPPEVLDFIKKSIFGGTAPASPEDAPASATE